MLRLSIIATFLAFPAIVHTETVRVATVNFAPEFGKVEANRQALVALTQEAAENGAKIIVHTEMATSGYSYFSRSSIAAVAEEVPGPTTDAIGAVAKLNEAYVAVGLPEYDQELNAYFNSVVLIGPDGSVEGTYRKRNNLIEAAYNSSVSGPVPTFDTPYGRLGIVICADMFYPHFPRAAAVSGVNILLAPANVGITTDFMRVRTMENNFSMVVANRYGSGLQGENIDVFHQDTFTIGSPFAYDFSFGSRSVIMTSGGRVLAEIDEDQDIIGYGELPIGEPQVFPVVRRPELYGLIGQDTLEAYTFTQLGLPGPRELIVAALDPDTSEGTIAAAIKALENAVDAANFLEGNLRLAVFPEGYFETISSSEAQIVHSFAQSRNVDILVSEATSGRVPVSTLFASNGEKYQYTRTHRARNSSIPQTSLAGEFWVVDRDYGRVALMQGTDMLPPETTMVLAKMGVDIIAVSANDSSDFLNALWATRTANYVHIVVANKAGDEGVFLGGYQSNPSSIVGSGSAIAAANTEHVRNKKEPRFFDYRTLVRVCEHSNC